MPLPANKESPAIANPAGPPDPVLQALAAWSCQKRSAAFLLLSIAMGEIELLSCMRARRLMAVVDGFEIIL